MNKVKAVSASIAASAAVIVTAILGIEGGYVDHPTDPGGKTNYGITEQVARSYGYAGNMADLPEKLAKDIYLQEYVYSPNFDLLIEVSEPVAEKAIDVGVNTGPRRSVTWLQKSLNSLSRNGKDYLLIAEDGILGQQTVEAFNGLAAARGYTQACSLVLKLMDAQQAIHYMGLLHLRDFTVGWVEHRIGNVPVSRCYED